MEQSVANKRLDFEIARLKNCGELMKAGIMFHQQSPYYKVCADVVLVNPPVLLQSILIRLNINHYQLHYQLVMQVIQTIYQLAIKLNLKTIWKGCRSLVCESREMGKETKVSYLFSCVRTYCISQKSMD